MVVAFIYLVIAVLGAIGGLGNCLQKGGFKFPRMNWRARVWKPGGLENIFIGAMAAVLVGGIYGPFGDLDFLHPPEFKDLHLLSGPLVKSMVVGYFGGHYLNLMSRHIATKLALDTQTKNVEKLTKLKLKRKNPNP